MIDDVIEIFEIEIVKNDVTGSVVDDFLVKM